MTPALKLNNDVTMPAPGLGVFQSPPEEPVNAVETALRGGRGEIFVTTKLWISDYGYDSALVGFEASLRPLGVDHVDLYLLHQPVPTDFENIIAAYKAAEQMLADGRARAIGVSNFSREHLRRLIERTDAGTSLIELAIAFVVNHPAVTSAIMAPGPSNSSTASCPPPMPSSTPQCSTASTRSSAPASTSTPPIPAPASRPSSPRRGGAKGHASRQRRPRLL